MNRKLLIIELWGIGDLTFTTPVLKHALECEREVHLLSKAHAQPLLAPSFPKLKFHTFDAPWTRYKGKYDLWNWDWPRLGRIIAKLRAENFDLAVSVRNDPRDHLFMYLLGARERLGYPRHGSGILLSRTLDSGPLETHKVEDWQRIGQAIGYPQMQTAPPFLQSGAYGSARISSQLASVKKPILCLHTGARIQVRRWKESSFAEILQRLRQHYDFHLLLIPDPDGYGRGLASLADTVLTNIDVSELVAAIDASHILLCNDSGPSHIAASLHKPTIAIFGPSNPAWFRPWGDLNHVVKRDICPWRPCFDYCNFSEPYCMTALQTQSVWPEIHHHIESLLQQGVLPSAFRLPLMHSH